MFEVALDKQEAVRRLSKSKSNSVCWTFPEAIVEYKYISADQVKNWDGSFAGDGQDPSIIVLQRMVWRDGCSPRFTNWW
jgi:hypothetical protein